jgi:proteasome accessory factor B
MAVERISPSERQLNLTFALLRSPNGLTKQEIFATVPGYGYKTRVDAATEKQFERDKLDIRSAGVVLEKFEVPGFSSDNQDYRYRVASKSFDWPADFKPTALQTRLLELAAHCWQDVSLSGELQMAMTRLVALGESPDRQAISELVPSFRPLDAAFGPLASAIEDLEPVTFSYRKAGGAAPEKRTVSPWRFLNVEGEWLIQGWDHDREATRNFLLQRIVDKQVKLAARKGLEFVKATPELLGEAHAELEEFRAGNVATIKVSENTAAWTHFGMSFEATDTKSITYLDPELLAAKLRRFGGQVEILAPESLIKAVRAGLEAVAKSHA